MRDASVTTPNQSAGPAAVDAVIGALERLVADLRRRTEAAESRAEAAEKRLDLEREGRQGAETRAAAAERTAEEALRRAETAEAAMRESIEQLRRELQTAIRQVADLGKTRAAPRSPSEPHRQAEAGQDAAYHQRLDRGLSHIATPASGRMTADQPAQRQRSREERGYAWVEDEPGPPWWRRIFRRHY
jgi:chromosome segregation ATPase